MNSVEKSEDLQYQEWVSKNEKFLERYIDEHLEKFSKYVIHNKSDLLMFLLDLNHEEWKQVNRVHLYPELQELLNHMLPYYLNNINKRGYAD